MGTQIKDDDYAFPIANNSNEEYYWIHKGVTIRAYFAGQNVAALLANSDTPCSPKSVSQLAVDYADALIAELNKAQTP